MARNRKKWAPAGKDTSFNPAEFQPDGDVVNAPSEQPQAEPGRAEQPAPVQPQEHADKVKRRGYGGAGMTDALAGARLLEHADPYLSVIRFDEKPSDAVRAVLKDGHFDWRPDQKEWTRAIRFDARASDRIDAERVFAEACKQIRADKGITHSYG